MSHILNFRNWQRVYETEGVTDPKAVPQPKISFQLDTELPISTITGYESAMLKACKISTYVGNISGEISITAKFAGQLNNSDVGWGFGKYYFDINYGTQAKQKPPQTRAEVETLVKTFPADGNTVGFGMQAPRGDGMYKERTPFLIKAGGTWTDKNKKVHSWGRSGATVGSELTDIICKILGITA
jgi:hypothetical protein